MKKNPDSYRKARANELRTLAALLTKHGVCADSGPLLSAANRCEGEKPNGSNSWGYRVERLILRLPHPQRKCVPSGVHDLSVEFSLEVAGMCLRVDHEEDPFFQLGMDIVVRGRTASKSNVICAWHLDRHIGGHGEASTAHPHYHFQFGGKQLWAELADSGDALFLEPPRLAHPPLEAILGVDFAVSNFKSSEWEKLRLDPEYEKIVEQTQNRVWRAYAKAVSDFWSMPCGPTKLWARAIWPQLIGG